VELNSLDERRCPMTSIHQVLKLKGRDVFTIGPYETVYAAVALMAEADVGALLVIDDGRFVGIFTERDYAREVVLKGRTSSQTFVRDIMRTDCVCVQSDVSVETCMELMTKYRVRHLPVVDDEKLAGIVSIGDLVKSIIDDQRFTIAQLEDYIHGELRHH
jgi:CBS domain-containing protein